MFPSDHSAHTGRTAHRDDRVQYLVVGDESALGELQAELALLPLCARGRVFVEAEGAAQVFPLSAPPRMAVTWLPRSARTGRPGTGERCARGEAALRAVRAWSAEMLCEGPGATRALVSGGYALVAGVVEHLVEGIGMAPEAITTPAPLGLPTAHLGGDSAALEC